MDFVMKNVIILISIMMEVIAALTLLTSMSFLQTSDFLLIWPTTYVKLVLYVHICKPLFNISRIQI